MGGINDKRNAFLSLPDEIISIMIPVSSFRVSSLHFTIVKDVSEREREWHSSWSVYSGVWHTTSSTTALTNSYIPTTWIRRCVSPHGLWKGARAPWLLAPRRQRGYNVGQNAACLFFNLTVEISVVGGFSPKRWSKPSRWWDRGGTNPLPGVRQCFPWEGGRVSVCVCASGEAGSSPFSSSHALLSGTSTKCGIC